MYTCNNTETRPPRRASVLASVSKLLPASGTSCESPPKRRVEKTNKRLKCSPDILHGQGKKGQSEAFLWVRYSIMHMTLQSPAHIDLNPAQCISSIRLWLHSQGRQLGNCLNCFFFPQPLLSGESLGIWVWIIKVVELWSNHIRKMEECNKQKVPTGLFRKWSQKHTQKFRRDLWPGDILDEDLIYSRFLHLNHLMFLNQLWGFVMWYSKLDWMPYI